MIPQIGKKLPGFFQKIGRDTIPRDNPVRHLKHGISGQVHSKPRTGSCPVPTFN